MEHEEEASGREAALKTRVRTLQEGEELRLLRGLERLQVAEGRSRVPRGRSRAMSRRASDMGCPGDCDPECSGRMPRRGRIR